MMLQKWCIVQQGQKKIRPVNYDLATKHSGFRLKQETVTFVNEMIETSAFSTDNTGKEPNHDWLDANGWEHWVTYIQDKDNSVYKATLNIALSDDGVRRLFDIDSISLIEIGTKKEAGQPAKSGTSSLQNNPTTTPTESQDGNKLSARDTLDTSTSDGEEVRFSLRTAPG